MCLCIDKPYCEICKKDFAHKTISWYNYDGTCDMTQDIDVCIKCELEIKVKIEKMREAYEKKPKDGDLAIKFLNKFFENLDV